MASRERLEVHLSSSVDMGNLLSRLDDPAVTGARQVYGADAFAAVGAVVMGAKERDGWLALEIPAMESCEGGA